MILVVDDHDVLGRGISLMLQQAGHEATHVLSGEAALEFIKTRRPLVVVLDQNMPGLTGIDVLRRLRSQTDQRRIAVILNSAGMDASTEAEARRLGADAVLRKGSDDWANLIGVVNDLAQTGTTAGGQGKTTQR